MGNRRPEVSAVGTKILCNVERENLAAISPACRHNSVSGPIMTAYPTRRELLRTSLGLPAISLRTGIFPVGKTVKVDHKEPKADRRGMKLSLSVRVAETTEDKEKSSLTLDDLINLARRHDYEALCMRPSQTGIHAPPEKITTLSRKIRDAGLVVSMVTGDLAVPRNNERGPLGLRNITPYLNLAEAFGANLIRICMKREEDIRWARRACDEARERRLRLAHQTHLASLFETVEGSLYTLKAVGRKNFGVIYEPENWMIAGQNYGRETIEQLRPYIFNVYVQNHRLHPHGKLSADTSGRGEVRFNPIGLWDKGGVNFREVFGGLRSIDYRGFVTVHQTLSDLIPVEVAVERSSKFLKAVAALTDSE